jgi:hypothetical protein
MAVAARRIEQGLFDLGGRADLPLAYYGATQFTPSASGVLCFFLTKFLALLETNVSADRNKVNCTDCAAAVIAFANALGCSLALHRIRRAQGFGFDTNPTLKIGHGSPTRDFFGQHDIAIRRGAIDSAHHVYDACLMVDRDTNPASAKKTDLGPAHGAKRGAFSVPSSKSFTYIQRLIARDDLLDCEGVDLNLPCLDVCIDVQRPSPPLVELWNGFRLVIEAIAPPLPVSAVDTISLAPVAVTGYQLYERVLQPIHLAVLRNLVEQSVEFSYVATRGDDDRRLRISIGSASSASKARDALAWVLTQSDSPPAPIRLETGAIGDASFADDAAAAQFFVRGQVIACVRSIGRSPVPLTPIMQTLDDAFRTATGPKM